MRERRNAPLRLQIWSGGRLYSIVTRLGRTSESPPRRFLANWARIRTLLVQVTLLTRNAGPPQFTADRLVNALSAHSDCVSRLGLTAMKTPKCRLFWMVTLKNWLSRDSRMNTPRLLPT